MKKYLVCKTVQSVDGYEEEVVERDYPKFVCDSLEDAEAWISKHAPVTAVEETWYGKVELTDEYYVKEIPYFPAGEINYGDKHEEDDDW